jgi:ankyrin repeat protein
LEQIDQEDWLTILTICERWQRVGREVFDPSQKNNKAIRWACLTGNVHVVKYLLRDPRVDPSADLNFGLRMASEKGMVSSTYLNNQGYLEIVKLLLKHPLVDPTSHDNLIFTWAVERGHLEIVQELLQDKRIDPATNQNYAISCACRCGSKHNEH